MSPHRTIRDFDRLGQHGLLHSNHSSETTSHYPGNLFQIRVIEIDAKGNSEVKYLQLETLVNELRATEKAKLEKLLRERTDQELYAWNGERQRLERNSLKSREYLRQKRSQLPLRDLRMFFRHINLGK